MKIKKSLKLNNFKNQISSNKTANFLKILIKKILIPLIKNKRQQFSFNKNHQFFLR